MLLNPKRARSSFGVGSAHRGHPTSVARHALDTKRDVHTNHNLHTTSVHPPQVPIQHEIKSMVSTVILIGNKGGYTIMKPKHMLRILGLSVFLSLASLALPLPAHAGVHVSIGLPLPVPVVVAPAPVVVAPPPAVVYPAPVVVGPGYYGYYGYYGYRPWYWRHHHHHGWRRW